MGNINGTCTQNLLWLLRVAIGLDVLTFEERQNLLRLVVERAVVTGSRVRVETVIPTDKQHAGLLSTRHPELDSGSRSIER